MSPTAGYGAAAFGAGSLFSFAGNLMKKRVAVPEFKPIDSQAEQKKAVDANAANLPGAQSLASDVNRFNQAELMDALRSAIPNFDQIAENTNRLVQDFTAPGIPQDIQDLIRRKSTARAVEGGYGGSQAATNLELRNLGLTGLELASKKLGAAESWLGFARQNMVAPQFDVTSMFLTPQQQIALSVSERDKQFNRDFANNQISAAQHWRTLMGNEFVEFGSSLKGAGSGMIGSGMGGGGGGTSGGTGMTFRG